MKDIKMALVCYFSAQFNLKLPKKRNAHTYLQMDLCILAAFTDSDRKICYYAWFILHAFPPENTSNISGVEVKIGIPK